jgi:uncharacterized membrane protein YvbJ
MDNRLKGYDNRNRIMISRRRLWMIGSIILALLVLFSMYFVSKTVTAQREGRRIKLVTSVEIEKGDTLWSIASRYITEEYDDINDYIKELKNSNGLTSDTIHAGNFIIVPYYADASR